jgi:hypothetical protein
MVMDMKLAYFLREMILNGYSLPLNLWNLH